MNFKFRDVLLALLCAFLGSVKGLLVSQVKSLGAIEIFGIRSIGATCFILPIIIYKNFQVWYDLKCNTILFIRSIIGNVAVCGYYFGFVYLPIAEASMLFYSTPVFTVIIGCVFLKEQCGIVEIISISLSLLGVALVCFPDFNLPSSEDTDTLLGVSGALIGAIAQAIALAVIRKITFVPPPVVSFWWASVGILFSCALSPTQAKGVEIWRCGLEPVIIIFIAVVGFVSELCLVAALKSTDAVVVSIVLTTEIVWAFVLQISVNNELPNVLCFVGGLAIMVSVIIPAVTSFVMDKKSKLNENEKEKHNEKNNTNAVSV